MQSLAVGIRAVVSYRHYKGSGDYFYNLFEIVVKTVLVFIVHSGDTFYAPIQPWDKVETMKCQRRRTVSESRLDSIIELAVFSSSLWPSEIVTRLCSNRASSLLVLRLNWEISWAHRLSVFWIC
jgi:hypothetical protein